MLFLNIKVLRNGVPVPPSDGALETYSFPRDAQVEGPIIASTTHASSDCSTVRILISGTGSTSQALQYTELHQLLLNNRVRNPYILTIRTK